MSEAIHATQNPTDIPAVPHNEGDIMELEAAPIRHIVVNLGAIEVGKAEDAVVWIASFRDEDVGRLFINLDEVGKLARVRYRVHIKNALKQGIRFSLFQSRGYHWLSYEHMMDFLAYIHTLPSSRMKPGYTPEFCRVLWERLPTAIAETWPQPEPQEEEGQDKLLVDVGNADDIVEDVEEQLKEEINEAETEMLNGNDPAKSVSATKFLMNMVWPKLQDIERTVIEKLAQSAESDSALIDTIIEGRKALHENDNQLLKGIRALTEQLDRNVTPYAQFRDDVIERVGGVQVQLTNMQKQMEALIAEVASIKATPTQVPSTAPTTPTAPEKPEVQQGKPNGKKDNSKRLASLKAQYENPDIARDAVNKLVNEYITIDQEAQNTGNASQYTYKRLYWKLEELTGFNIKQNKIDSDKSDLICVARCGYIYHALMILQDMWLEAKASAQK